jgi:hypothetical protein
MSVTIDGTNGITTPEVDSTGPIAGTTGTFSGAVQASGVATNLYPLVSGTSQTASSTSVDFTGIPSWVKRITVMFSGVSTSGTSAIQIQIGAGSFVTTGYSGATATVGTSATGLNVQTAGFVLAVNVSAATTASGVATLALLGSNIWTETGTVFSRNDSTGVSTGSITLGGTLDRVRVTTANGTDTFDAGTINILYE